MSSNGVATALATKVDKNAEITGATKTKITYDVKGLVTGGDDATTADIADSTNKRYVTDAQQTVIVNTSGINTGNETTASIQSKRPLKTIEGQSLEGVGNIALGLFYRGHYTAVATAQTVFTVTIGATMANTNYRVPQPGAQNALSSGWCYITNKTLTTFDVVTMSGITGTFSIDWVVFP